MKKATIFQTTITKISFVFTCVLFLSLGAHANNPDGAEGEGDNRMKIRLKFNSVNGFDRDITVLADENATGEFDSEFDLEVGTIALEDMYWLIDNVKFSNQGINEITEETILPLGIHTISSGMNTISIDKLENIPADMRIFLHDKDLGVYHSIKEDAYQINLSPGVYFNRFEIVFSEQQTLGTNEVLAANNSLRIFFDTSTDNIKVLNNANKNIETVEVYSILGHSVNRLAFNSKNDVYINADQLSSGTYIVMVKAENNITSKKILVN